VSIRSRLILKLAVVVAVLYCFGCVAGGVLLAELQLHPPRMPLRRAASFSRQVREYYGADLQEISIAAVDNVSLRAWYVVPEHDNGSVVILLHGVGDNREGVAGYSKLFLQRGYRVLLPDARAHGSSGGSIATYGLLESEDIHRWVNWVETAQPKCVYGFGESMGAALLLQSLEQENRFCAVVAESPFADFRQVALERSARYLRMPFWFGRTVERPVVEFALYYCRLKYGIDFRRANPADAVAQTQAPILLIGDAEDEDVLPHHVLDLGKLNPRTAQVWMVQGAAHGGAWGANPNEFNRRVSAYLAAHL
jgi:pimeloyl-ACP methyl ester carboxylesterase